MVKVLGVVTLAFALPLAQGSDCALVPKGLLERPRAEFTGQYTNHVYGYSVVIPQGLRGFSSPPPAPQHGFGVPIGNEPRSYLMVSGSWNSLEYENVQRAADAEVESIRERHKVVSVDFRKARLDGLDARRVVIHYTCGTPPTEFVEDTTIAIAAGKVLEVTLWTSQMKHREDERVLDAVLRSWKNLDR